MNFHPLRHYRSALIARSCFYDEAPDLPAWAVEIAHANRDIQQAGEPPIGEWIACTAYAALGHEQLAVPRLLSTCWWLLGVWPLVVIVRRLVSMRAAVLAAALHLFLPYAIVATRTFQPDPLMTTCALGAIAGLLAYHDRQTGREVTLAGVLMGTALLVKPMSVFVVMPGLAAVVLARQSWRAAMANRGLWVVLIIALFPPALYYGDSMLFGRLAQDQFQTRFVPSLIPTAFFWRGLARQLHHVLGWPVIAAALLGTLAAAHPLTRRLLRWQWIGYAAFAVAFTYHVPTHDYYSLPFLPIAAIAAAAVVDRATARVSTRAADLVVVTGCLAIAAAGSWMAWPHLTTPGAVEAVADARRIGDATHHDGRVLFLDLEYGYPLMYHAEVAGDTWPGADDLEAERLDGRPPIGAAARFARDYAAWAPHYFVVTDMSSLKAEPDLEVLLAERTDLIDVTPRHRVYRFR